MFNAFPEPCSPSGRSTNVKRALAAAVLSSNILPVKGTSHRLFNPTPSVAELTRGYYLARLRGLTPSRCCEFSPRTGLDVSALVSVALLKRIIRECLAPEGQKIHSRG